MDVHATSIQVITLGYPTEHPISSWKFVLTVILMSLALFGLYLKRAFFKKAKFKIEDN